MRIGELAKRTGLAASRIRFYEASGLITSVARKANGYRDYSPEAVVLLEIITGIYCHPRAMNGCTMRWWVACVARWQKSRCCRSVWRKARRGYCWR